MRDLMIALLLAALAMPTWAAAQKDQRSKVAPAKRTALQSVPSDRILSKAQYQRQLQSKRLLPINLDARRKGVAARQQETAKARTYLQQRLAKAPQQLKAKQLQQVALKPDRRVTKVLPDGNIETRIRTRRGPQKRVLLGEDFALRSLARSASESAKLDGSKRIYQSLHSELARATKSGKTSRRALSRYPTLTARGDVLLRGKPVSDRQFMASLATIVGFWQQETSEPEPQGPFLPSVRCDEEEYYGDGSDGGVGDWPTFHSQGLYANVDWPLKPHTTCVKNQANRGTCVAFSLTAAVESRVSVQSNRKVNLSEQELYNTEKMSPFSLPPNCGDGLMPVFELFGLTVTGYEFTQERRWDYNPSWSRTDAPFLSAECYLNSCVRYTGEACSNSNHQARRVCSNGLFGETCGYEDPVQGETNIAFESSTTLLNLFDREGSLDQAIALLNAKVPVVLSFGVHTSFDETPNSGYTEMPSGDDPFRGNHAALLVGYVSNSNRPSGAPAGSGGGYFVLKNSWGRDVADNGFYYLPYNYVRDKATALDAIHSVDI